MPFLDLICCAFGGIILLYILADDRHGSDRSAVEGFHSIVAEVPNWGDNHIGLRLKGQTGQFSCWTKMNCDRGKVVWDISAGKTIASFPIGLIQDPIEIAVLTFPDPLNPPAEICVRVSMPGETLEASRKLAFDNGYRSNVSLQSTDREC